MMHISSIEKGAHMGGETNIGAQSEGNFIDVDARGPTGRSIYRITIFCTNLPQKTRENLTSEMFATALVRASRVFFSRSHVATVVRALPKRALATASAGNPTVQVSPKSSPFFFTDSEHAATFISIKLIQIP